MYKRTRMAAAWPSWTAVSKWNRGRQWFLIKCTDVSIKIHRCRRFSRRFQFPRAHPHRPPSATTFCSIISRLRSTSAAFDCCSSRSRSVSPPVRCYSRCRQTPIHPFFLPTLSWHPRPPIFPVHAKTPTSITVRKSEPREPCEMKISWRLANGSLLDLQCYWADNVGGWSHE